MLSKFEHLRITLALIILSIVIAPATKAVAPLSNGLELLLSNSPSGSSDSLISVVVFLEQPENSVDKMQAPSAFTKRADRIKQTLTVLRNRKGVNSAQIASFLDSRSPEPVTPLWIVPAYSARLTINDIDQLRAMDGVKRIVENVALSYEPPVSGSPAPTKSAAVSNHLEMLNVPYLWQRGLTGTGRLICSFDTGVMGSHPALQSKWRGQHAPLSTSWFSPITPNNAPSDNIGHGTHTMGIMVGSTDADTIGVAPGAEWISAGVIDQGRELPVTLNDILNAYQWVLNPDGNNATTDDVPDVILNSWGIPKGLFSPCDDIFVDVINAVESAGIVTIFAVGNEGPNPMTVRSPADIASTPYNTFSVGSVDNARVISSFSSRGPSSCDQSSVKPEIVAPGVSVRSSWKDGSYFYMTGTSMAAPFIAGLVALMRQYNPDATVQEIKSALINSSVDLGAAGEDNSYGYGLPDASRLLSLIEEPVSPDISIESETIINGFAQPGDPFQLRLSLTNPASNVDLVNGTIAAVDSNAVQLINEQTTFYFGTGGTNAINVTPYDMVFSPDLYNGQQVPFELYLSYADGTVFDTLYFSLTAGIAPNGTTATHSNGAIEFSVSDFGQYGLASTSSYNLNQPGLRFNGSENLLYEAGVVVGRSNLQLASTIRDSLGRFKPSELIAAEDQELTESGLPGEQRLICSMTDKYAPVPLPITVSQETITYDSFGDEELVIMRYKLLNQSLAGLTGVHFAFMIDLDLPDGAEVVRYDPVMGMAYQMTDSGGPIVGVLALNRQISFKSYVNGINKSGMDNVQLYDAISTVGNSVDTGVTGDLYMMACAGPFSIAPAVEVEIALALVFGDDLSSLYENAARAKEKYDFSTAVNENDYNLPDEFQLSQNYPNPFNPSTTIAFSLPTAGDVSLEVLNLLGQHVKTIFSGILPAGTHNYQWDSRSESGKTASSGIYFYRLTTKQGSQSRKMTLLK